MGITLMDSVLLSIDEILARPDEDFLQVVDYVIQKILNFTAGWPGVVSN